MPASDRPSARDLQADCASCFGLCCVVPAFAASADFAIDKPAGRACLNLLGDSRCGIHDRLRTQGFRGCTVYDCFGAGQKVSQQTFAGQDWREGPAVKRPMFDVFPIMRDLHELLRYLSEAVGFTAADPVRGQLLALLDEITGVTLRPADVLASVDTDAYRSRANPLLSQASELARSASPGPRPNHRGADLVGATLRSADLRGANLRGAYLIAADLRSADLRGADVIGADFRDADIRGADLRGCVFLVGSQLQAARGDHATKLPDGFDRPGHWVS